MKELKKYAECNKSGSCNSCINYNHCFHWKEFVTKHSDLKLYAHFDKKSASLRHASIRHYVMDENKIAHHGFYPFIHYKYKQRKYTKNTDLQVREIKTKEREIHYCSHLDRCVYQRYSFLLNEAYNSWVNNNNISNIPVAYRNCFKGKSNIHFAKIAFDKIKELDNAFIIIGDFTDFFDNLDHKYLKQQLCKILNYQKLPNDFYAVFKNITKFSYCNWTDIVQKNEEKITTPGIRTKLNSKELIITKEQLKQLQKHKLIHKNENNKGVPQGSPISAVLSNIYMIEFDKEINKFVTQKNGLYMRYSDDFIIILPFEIESEINEFIKLIVDYFNNKSDLLTLQQDKTKFYIYKNKCIYKYPQNQLTHLKYLGFIFDGTNIKINPKAITKYYYRMQRKARNIVRCNWTSSKGHQISAKNLYRVYASNNKKSKSKHTQTFIDSAKKAKKILNLNDPETDSLIKTHKQKIAKALKTN